MTDKAFEEWKKKRFPYHHQEAMWTRMLGSDWIEEAYQAGVAQGMEEKWIAVEDRLPEISTRHSYKKLLMSDLVLIWWLRGDEEEDFSPKPAVSMGKYYHGSDEFRPVGCNGDFSFEITHWQPLPSPPKANEEKKP